MVSEKEKYRGIQYKAGITGLKLLKRGRDSVVMKPSFSHPMLLHIP